MGFFVSLRFPEEFSVSSSSTEVSPETEDSGVLSFVLISDWYPKYPAPPMTPAATIPIITFRTMIAVDAVAAADAAEPVVCIPLMQMKRRECRIEIFSGALIAQLADRKGLITAEGFRGLRQKEGFLIDGEQIDRRVTLCCQLAVTRELRFAVRDRSEQLFAAEAHHDAVRLRRSLLPAVV
jgi:hypothetical protein